MQSITPDRAQVLRHKQKGPRHRGPFHSVHCAISIPAFRRIDQHGVELVGRLIPAGTGGATRLMRAIATERDAKVIDDRRGEAEAAAMLAAPMSSDVIGGDEFDTMLVDTPESRD